MAETSNIAWTHSTFNPWIGCTKVSPGCDGCYAEALDKRMRFGGAVHWGAGVPRFRTSASNWAKPLTWNNKRAKAVNEGNAAPWRVFCASLADVFDNEVPDEWRTDLWRLIEKTPYLDWLLVTKRIGNAANMLPPNWLSRSRRYGWPRQVRLLITVVNQEEADRDIPKLLALPCKNGVSYEPALGPVDWSPELGEWEARDYLRGQHLYYEVGDLAGVGGGRVVDETRSIQWVIIGGESSQGGHPARPFHIGWARSTVQQCKAAGVPVFVKQIGTEPRGWCKNILDDPTGEYDADFCDLYEAHESSKSCDRCIFLKDRAGADPEEWPEDLRVREFPT